MAGDSLFPLYRDEQTGQVIDGVQPWAPAGPLVFSNGFGGKQAIVAGSPAGPTALTAAQAQAVILGDALTGQRFTLPAPVPGLEYEFVQTATITSGNLQIDTDAGTTFLVGMVNSCIDNTATDKPFAANGTTHTHIICNGTTTGGIKGQYLKLICVDATHWLVTGTLAASGAIATPFS